MSLELTITIKDQEGKKLTMPYLVYEDVTFRPSNPRSDPVIDRHVKELLDEFDGEPDDVKIKALMVL